MLTTPAGAQPRPSFDVDTATNAYLATVSPTKKARSDSYFEGGYWITLLDFLFGAVLSLFLLRTRLSARLRGNAERITRRGPLVIWLYCVQYFFLIALLTLPITLYEGFFREHQYGLSNLTLVDWFVEQGKGLALGVAFGGLAFVALLIVVRRLPRTWHLWGTVITIIFQGLTIVAFPVFVMPLFNKYAVLTDARVRDPILRLARQNGIPAANVYEVDASRQSNRVSANVSGFLRRTERITLNDNLLNRCSPQAVEAVMGHEMGHYVLNHQYKMLAFMSILVMISFSLLRWLLTWALARWGTRWEIRDLNDPAVLPLAALIISALFLLYTPITNTLIRTQEYEADIFGLNTARQPDSFAEAALILGDYRKLDPAPLEEFIFFDHPSGRTRIHASMRWKAQNQDYQLNVPR